MLQSMGSQRVRHDWRTELNWSVPDTSALSHLSYIIWKICFIISILPRENSGVLKVKRANIDHICSTGQSQDLSQVCQIQKQFIIFWMKMKYARKFFFFLILAFFQHQLIITVYVYQYYCCFICTNFFLLLLDKGMKAEQSSYTNLFCTNHRMDDICGGFVLC